MNWKIFLVLIVVAAVAVFTSFELNNTRPVTPVTASVTGKLLYPELNTQLNTITALKVSSAGNTVVADLVRAEDNWQVNNKHGYPAALDKVRKVLLDLAATKIVEEKTANPDNYSRIGVQDISSTDASGFLLELSGADTPVSIIIGNSAAGTGNYIRRTGEAQSLQIDTAINIAADIADWLQQPIVVIDAERLQRAVIRHPDGELVTVSKQQRSDTDFQLFNMLQGRELSYETVANPVGNVLTNLQLEDVVPVADVDLAAQEIISSDYYSFDGLKITVQAFKQDDIAYMHLSADFDADQAQQFATDANSEKPNQEQQNNKIKAEAEQLNQQLANWVFAVSDFKYNNATKRLEDLLKPLPEPETNANPDLPAEQTPQNQ